MDKETFKIRLIEASESALLLAKEYTFNEISENLNYRIKPNSFDLSDHLTDLEKENLKCRKREILNIDEMTVKYTQLNGDMRRSSYIQLLSPIIRTLDTK